MSYQIASSFIDEFAHDVLYGAPPECWKLGAGFENVEIGPGQVVLLGGAPGAGKTALAMQWTVDALRTTASLRALVLNVEMHPKVLLERQLARLSGVDAGWIRGRNFIGQEDRIGAGLDVLRQVSERLAFHTGPPTLTDVAKSADAFGVHFLVLDYVQRIETGAAGPAPDKRTEIDHVMAYVRRFADKGVGVLAVCAVSRQKGNKGSAYTDLGLASYRGSSELEYGADVALVLDCGEKPGRVRSLACVKNRHGETFKHDLEFDGARQSFTVAACGALESGSRFDGNRSRTKSRKPGLRELDPDTEAFEDWEDDEAI